MNLGPTASALARFLERLATQGAMLVTVVDTQGSVPREVGAWMAVLDDAVVNTVGGGHLEFQAIAQARRLAAQSVARHRERYALGPSLGQCCGGAVTLSFEWWPAGSDSSALRERLGQDRLPVALFGAGHVGGALARLLSVLPFALTWVDSRDEIFPEPLPHGIVAEHSDPVQGAVASLAPGSLVLIMSFSHAEDLDVVAACLERHAEQRDLPFIGLIGSRSKWASFRSRLRERGHSDAALDHVTCPIGLAAITGKEPEVIATSVAAQLLLLRSHLAAARPAAPADASD